MQSLHLVHPNELHLGSFQLALPQFSHTDGYAAYFRRISQTRPVSVFLGASVPQQVIEDEAELFGASHIVLYWVPMARGQDSLIERIESLLSDYEVTLVIAAKTTEEIAEEYVKMIQVPGLGIGVPSVPTPYGRGLGRFDLIYQLVYQNIWSPRVDHYLYELENPAEMAVYADVFTHAIRGSIKGFLSSRCHVDSRYGIHYSHDWGLISPDPVPDDFLRPYTNPRQDYLFVDNAEMMDSYASGSAGDALSLELQEQRKWM